MLALAALFSLIPALVAGQDSSAAVASAAASVPGCALTCTLSLAGSSACGGVTNVTCLCTDATFQRDVYQCYVNTCSEADLQSAAAFGAQQCEAVGVTLNISAVPSGVTGVSTAAGGAAAATTNAGSTTAAPSTTSAPSSAASSVAASASPTGAAAGTLTQGHMLIGAVAAFAGVAGLIAIF